jgi:hypothetical protein
MIWVFSGFAEVLESRMGSGVFDDYGLHLFGDHAHEAFVEAHADLAHALWPESDSGGQDEIGSIGFEEVDRANVCFETLLYQPDDIVERFGGIAAM